MHRGAGVGTCVFLIAELQFCALHSTASSVSCVPKAGFLPALGRNSPHTPPLHSLKSTLLLSTCPAPRRHLLARPGNSYLSPLTWASCSQGHPPLGQYPLQLHIKVLSHRLFQCHLQFFYFTQLCVLPVSLPVAPPGTHHVFTGRNGPSVD